ncbi:MAG TPA: histone deacetylase [Thermoplasmatales archaeon]|nr:histone deacetylase [Thermoplasmatales archaeon]HEX17522.1 histone deacetylase [Thermoplasmatales archaeon]
MTLIAYTDKYLEHDNINHPENSERLISIMRVLKRSSIMKEVKLVEPKPCDEDIILEVHSEEMVNKVKELSETTGWIDLDTYVCIGSYEIARLAVGAVLDLAETILSGEDETGFALVRPPGHHATRNRSMGFCLFNNVAITAHLLAKKKKKILIFDHDVHHGNGTQDIFYEDPRVMYQSFHLSPHYPGTGDIDEVGRGDGEGYTINLPLPRGAGERTVLEAMDEVFIPIAEQFKPDLILVSAGFDSHYQDMLGGLRLSAESFYRIICKLRSVQPRIICSLEGGYNLEKLGVLVLSEILAMSGREIDYKEGVGETIYAKDRIDELMGRMREYWNV